MVIHLLHCVHGNVHTKTHDAIRDTFAAIAWDVDFHVRQEQLHALSLTTFNSFCQQINIVLTKDGIRTLIDIVITNPTRTNLFPWSCATQGFVTFDTAQAKKKSYHYQHPIDQFLPLSIEVFECLHKQVNVFLHNCANAIWSLKGPKGPPLFALIIFFEKISITLQRMQTSSILSQAHRPSYFPTSTHSRHTSHLHNQPIASSQFLTWRNMAEILRTIIFDMERFWHLVWANLTSCKFSLFLFLIPLYIFQIYGVFMN
jgi:hypothetical protein